MSDQAMSEQDWEHWLGLAQAAVRATQRSLPDSLRQAAEALPVNYYRRPSPEMMGEGIESDTLGLFVGPDFEEEPSAASPIPAQVILFLENIWEMVEADWEEFEEEIVTTYLHELGHYLGLDEGDLLDRGLE